MMKLMEEEQHEEICMKSYCSETVQISEWCEENNTFKFSFMTKLHHPGQTDVLVNFTPVDFCLLDFNTFSFVSIKVCVTRRWSDVIVNML